MAKKYLDLDGLSHFWQAIKNAFVADVTYNSSTKKIQKTKAGTTSDVVTLSTVATSGSYSDLSNKPTIPTLKNVFGKVKVGSTTIEADTTQDTLEIVAGSNVTVTPDATNDKITIKATDTTYSVFVSATADAAGQQGLVPAPHQGASAGSVLCEDGTWKPVMVLIGNNAVERAKADASGNTITSTYAPKASPALTGTPTAPTATAGTNSTQIATTAFVTSAVQTAITGAAAFQGTAPTSFAPTNYKKGYYWVVGTAGTYAGQVCEPGDMIFAVKDYGSAYAAADFNVIQTNLDITSITNAEIDTIVAA